MFQSINQSLNQSISQSISIVNYSTEKYWPRIVEIQHFFRQRCFSGLSGFQVTYIVVFISSLRPTRLYQLFQCPKCIEIELALACVELNLLSGHFYTPRYWFKMQNFPIVLRSFQCLRYPTVSLIVTFCPIPADPF